MCVGWGGGYVGGWGVDVGGVECVCIPACLPAQIWVHGKGTHMYATSLHACKHTSVMRAGRCPWVLQDGVT